MRIYLSGLCATGVNHFNNIFTSFYARQWYDVTNDVTHASLTVEDRLLIKALRIEKGWRCGSNFLPESGNKARFYARRKTYEQLFLVTMSTSTNKRRYRSKMLGLLLPRPWRKTLRTIGSFIIKILLYLICIDSLMTDT